MNFAKDFIYGAARAVGLFAVARVLTRHRVRMLCLHGGNLGDEHLFNPLLFSTGEHVASRLAWLQARGFNWVSLHDALGLLKGSAPRPRLPVVVTVDDGWYSTASVLGPVVAQYGVPATLYLCTGPFVSGKPVAGVTVAYLLWKSGPVPVALQGLDPALDGVHDLADPQARRHLLRSSVQWVLQGPPEDIQSRLERLGEALGVSPQDLDLSSRRFSYMNASELHALREQGWSIELHGHEHRYPAGDPDALALDLQRCKAAFAAAGLPDGRHYCYPSGNHDEGAHRLLKLNQVDSATTCLPGLCPDGDSSALYYLPRFLDGSNISPLVFEAEMSGFADGVRCLVRSCRRLAARLGLARGGETTVRAGRT